MPIEVHVIMWVAMIVVVWILLSVSVVVVWVAVSVEVAFVWRRAW